MRESTKQDGRPGFTFYPKDWLSSKEIRISSLSARGLWIEILCLMFFEKKRGSLELPEKYKTDTKGDTKVDTKSYTKYLSELLSKKEDEISPLLEELRMNEVFSYKDDLMICRRMYYENKLSLTRRQSVLKRWNKNDTKKDTKKIQTVGEGKGSLGKDSFNNVLVSKMIKESKKELFNKIWLKYPNKDGKKEALAHFLVSVNSQKNWDDITIALRNYLGSDKVKKGYIKNGSTFFNNWKDWVNFRGVVGKGDGLTDKNRRSLSAIANLDLGKETDES